MSSPFDVEYGSDWYDSYYSYEEDFPVDELLDDQNHNVHSGPVERPHPELINPNSPKPNSPVICTDAIALFHTLNQSKAALRENTGMDSHSLRVNNVPGLLVLPLKDISLIRNDYRYGRALKHFVVLPTGENFGDTYPDLAKMIDILYAKN